MSESIFWKCTKVAGKGLGVVAIQHIPAGTRLVIEKPLMLANLLPGEIDPVDIYEKFEALPPHDKKTYLALYAAPLPFTNALEVIDEDIDELSGRRGLRMEVAKVTSIFITNCFEMWEPARGALHDSRGNHQTGIFPIAARFNHSCTPNVTQTWNPVMNALTMHAICDIKEGEELCDSYCKLGLTTADRREQLMIRYGFQCECDACNPLTEDWSTGEIRRNEISRLENDMWFLRDRSATSRQRVSGPLSASVSGDIQQGLAQHDPVLAALERLIRLLQEQGLIGHDLLQWYTFFAEYSIHHGYKTSRSLEMAQNALQLAIQIEGEDHPHVRECRNMINQMSESGAAT